MVNTRILEQRLGWRHGDGDDATPAPQRVAHAPMLQGRVDKSRVVGASRTPRRASVEDTWVELPAVESTIEDLIRRTGLVPGVQRGSLTGTLMDQLRTQVMRVIRDKGWQRIGITSPSRGAGRSFVSAALAASIARLDGVHVLLIDGDLDEPGLHRILGVEAVGPMSEVLTGGRAAESQLTRIGSSVAVALNDTPVAHGAELMLAPDGILALRGMIDAVAPDVAIVDLPPLLGHAATEAFLPQLDAVILISDGLKTSAADIIECERILEDQVPLLGIVLNKSEDADPRPRSRARRRY